MTAGRRQAMAPTSGTSLYRHFDSDGRLLYVGISLSAIHRLAQHRAKSSWADAIASVTVERFATRDEAHAAERQAIAAESPLHNVVRYGASASVATTAPLPQTTGLLPKPTRGEREAIQRRLRGAERTWFSLTECSKILGLGIAPLLQAFPDQWGPDLEIDGRELGFLARQLVDGRLRVDDEADNRLPLGFLSRTTEGDVMAGYGLDHSQREEMLASEAAFLRVVDGRPSVRTAQPDRVLA